MRKCWAAIIIFVHSFFLCLELKSTHFEVRENTLKYEEIGFHS